MDTSALKKFAQSARRDLVAQVSTRLDVVLAANSDERRDYPAAVTALEAAIQKADREQVIEKAAYTWFNRFCALTFMDRNNYNAVHIVTPGEDGIRPAILSEALGGHVDETVLDKDRARIGALLDRTAPSREPELEAYKILLASACQQWHKRMPFMFGRIEDWTELLMPGDLLAETSVLNEMRAVMSEEACQDVEIIGWLYQFYISEKKDEVFAALKKNVKITAANIPAATQLFTPHWIVRYLVENSLGRLWLLNKPGSNLAAQMEYYIAPEEPETDFLKVSKPEEIKICDPAVGSGHMLTYAFDLLYAIYEEEGYSPDDIPALILTHNLTGIEIDDRAGALAAFALTMKAASKLGRRKFLGLKTQPNICVLQNVNFTESEMQDVAAVVGKDLFTDALKDTLTQFEHAKNFGSLITPKLRDPSETLRMVEAKEFTQDLLLKDVQTRVTQLLRMSEALSKNYHVVVANPPYLSDKYYSETIKKFANSKFKNSRFNLYSLFIERTTMLAKSHGYIGMITLHSWMSGSKYKSMRENLIETSPTVTMAHLGAGGFDSIGGQVVSSTAFILELHRDQKNPGYYINLTHVDGEKKMASLVYDAHSYFDRDYCYRVPSAVFSKIPGAPFVYWISESELSAFKSLRTLDEFADFRQGMATTDNDRFLRLWHEMPLNQIAFGAESSKSEGVNGRSWFPYNKGGGDKRWYGHNDFVVNYENHGQTLIDLVTYKYPKISDPEFVIKNRSYYFRPSVTYSALSGGDFAARLSDKGFIFDTKGSCAFAQNGASREGLAALLNSRVASQFIKLLAPTLDFSLYALSSVPYPNKVSAEAEKTAKEALKCAKTDWDSYEHSWDFTTLPLLSTKYRADTLEGSYETLRTHWQGITNEMQRLEEENNRIFIDAYGLEDELTPEVPLKEITLTCNPHYRYSRAKDWEDDDYEEGLWEDTIKEFLSYAVGCMFGRYSLDAPGLILANQGETLQDYLAKVPSPTFDPDDDNVIPILDGDWFSDDITQRFRDFLRVTFGEEHFVENLEFIEEALGKDIRKYFLKDFYTDHVKRYKKRPIYWQFSSPKGYFNALIYMHRYRSDTVSIVLNDYLRDFKAKLQAHIKSLEAVTLDPSTSDREKTKAGKEIDNTRKALNDIESYESEILFPLAEQQIDIDLDDGVKQNYPKFGKALKKVTGLSAK